MSDSSRFPAFEEPDWGQPAQSPVPAPTNVPAPTHLEWEMPPLPGATTYGAEPVFPPPVPPAPPHRGNRRGVAAVAASLVVTAVIAFLIGGSLQGRSTPSAVGVASPSAPAAGSAPAAENGSSSSSPSAADNSSSGTTSDITALYRGIVNINTEVGYQGGRAAGTGMVLTSSGEVLTNNHVIDGSTKISVTAVDTGRTYPAHVVGTAPTNDVAVIQLEGASKLSTVTTANNSNVKIGDPVIALGNAGGRGGEPSVVEGSVTALGQSITASDENGGNAEQLSDLIEVDAPIEAGDSGGPLVNASGEVIGMNSAAEVSGSRFRSAPTTTAGYAIPIGNALSIAHTIEAGKASSTIHIGLPAFLGVQVSGGAQGSGAGTGGRFGGGSGLATSPGAPVAGVVPGTAAESIGLAAGDTITSVNGQDVTSASALSPLLQNAKPGDKVTIGWTDESGNDHTAKATLTTGPAD